MQRVDQLRARSEIARFEQRRERRSHEIRIADVEIAIGVGETPAFCEEVRGLDRIGLERAQIETLEDPEDLQHRETARAGRRHAAHLPAAVRAAQRLALLRRIGGEVRLHEVAGSALVAAHRGCDLARDLAAVERVGAARRDAREHSRVLRVLEQRSRGLRLAVGQKEVAAGVGVEREKPVGGDQSVQTRRDRESLPRQLDRGLEEARPGKLAVPAVRELEEPQQARHAHGFSADHRVGPIERATVGPEKAPGRSARGRGLPAVVGFELRVARRVMKQESAAAQPRGLRLDQAEHELHGDRSVDRVPAAADRVVPGTRGERMRRDHHEALRDDGLRVARDAREQEKRRRCRGPDGPGNHAFSVRER